MMKLARIETKNCDRRMSAFCSKRRISFLQAALRVAPNIALSFAFVICAATVLRAQDANGPLTPPPEHDVHRVTTNQPVEAPPAKPPAEIVKEFAAKEEKFLRARGGYGYKKSIKLTEYAHDGQPSGEFQMTLAGNADSEGGLSEKVLKKKPSTLQY